MISMILVKFSSPSIIIFSSLFTSSSILMVMIMITKQLYAQNIDTKFPIIFQLPPTANASSLSSHRSLFGHSVLMHESDQHGPIFIIGAPNSTDFEQNQLNPSNSNIINNTGLVYRCELLQGLQSSILQTACSKIDLPKHMRFYDEELFTEKMNLGWNLVSRSKTDEFLTCAFSRTVKLYARTLQNQIELWQVPNGACFLIPDSFGNNDENQQIPKLILPMSNEEQFSRNRQYLYAYGMAGMSAIFSYDENKIYLGAPGFDDWSGTMVEVDLRNYPDYQTKINDKIQITSLSPKERDAYLGYSITRGKYFKNKEHVILGAPRKNLFGAIVLFDKTSNDSLSPPMILSGRQPGEYYGHSLLTVDTNQDGADDLLVAAPMFSSLKKDFFDEGRVFFYLSDGFKGFKEPKILSGDSKTMARFGTSMVNLGDINKDKFPDVAIGAPYEDDFKGSIYIYRGSKQGLLTKYSQKISASQHLSSINLQGFGYSLSSNVDIDNNDFNDILVGSYLSEKAILLRTRSIISIQPSIQLNNDYIDFDQPCKFADDDIQNVLSYQPACVRLKYCFEITSPFSIHSSNLVLLASLRLDPILNRAFIIVNDQRLKDVRARYRQSRLLTQEFILVPPNTNYCSNYYIVYFKEFDKIDNLFDYVVFELEYSLETSSDDQDNDDYIFYLPILENNITSINTELYFKMCKKTPLDCVANLHLDPMFYLDDKQHIFPNDSSQELIEGAYRLITLDAKVINYGEPAFKTELTILINQSVSLMQLDPKCHANKMENRKKNHIFVCLLNNPLTRSDGVVLKFKAFNVRDSENIHLELKTSSLNIENITNYRVSFRTIKQADINLKVIDPDIETMFKRYRIVLAEISLNSTIKIIRLGPSSINSIQLDVIYPECYDQHELITQVQIISIDNLVSLKCEQSVVFNNQLYDNYKNISSHQSQIYLNLNQTTRIINLNCVNQKIICRQIRCYLGPWDIEKSRSSSLFLRLNGLANIKQIEKKFRHYKFTNLTMDIYLNATIVDKHIQAHQKGSSLSNYRSDQIRFILVPIWLEKQNYYVWIALSIILGLLTFASITFLFCKLGFFKRERPKQLKRARLIRTPT